MSQHAKKVVSDSLRPVDFAIGLGNSFLNLWILVNSFLNLQLERMATCKIDFLCTRCCKTSCTFFVAHFLVPLHVHVHVHVHVQESANREHWIETRVQYTREAKCSCRGKNPLCYFYYFAQLVCQNLATVMYGNMLYTILLNLDIQWYTMRHKVNTYANGTFSWQWSCTSSRYFTVTL